MPRQIVRDASVDTSHIHPNPTLTLVSAPLIRQASTSFSQEGCQDVHVR
jgi:hypothetical protein